MNLKFNFYYARKVFVCQHSQYQKVTTDELNKNKRDISKNTRCEAQIIATIKLTTRNTIKAHLYKLNYLPLFHLVAIITRISHSIIFKFYNDYKMNASNQHTHCKLPVATGT